MGEEILKKRFSDSTLDVLVACATFGLFFYPLEQDRFERQRGFKIRHFYSSRHSSE